MRELKKPRYTGWLKVSSNTLKTMTLMWSPINFAKITINSSLMIKEIY
jgi:hypothetical protein